MTKPIDIKGNTLFLDGTDQQTLIIILHKDKYVGARLDSGIAQVAQDYPLPTCIFSNGNGFAINFSKVVAFGPIDKITVDPSQTPPVTADTDYKKLTLKNLQGIPRSFVLFPSSIILWLPVTVDILQQLRAQQLGDDPKASADDCKDRPADQRRLPPPPTPLL